MEVDLIFKIAIIGIIVALLNIVLEKADRKEQAFMVTLAGIIIVVLMVINEIGALFETIKSVFGL